MRTSRGEPNRQLEPPLAAAAPHRSGFRQSLLVRLSTLSRLHSPVVALVIVLFVWLAFCAYPVADDFAFAWRSVGSSFVDVQLLWYRDWSDKWFGTFCISLFLAAFDLVRHYWLAPLLLIAATGGASWWLVRSLTGARLAARDGALAGASMLALSLAMLRGPNESIYWLVAAYEYQVASIAALVLLALLLQRPATPPGRWINGAAATIVAFCAVGGTETMMVAIVIGGATWLAATVVLARRAPTARQACVVLAIAAGTALMLCCPGNENRASNFPDAQRLGDTLVRATTRGLLCCARWTMHPALLGASLLAWRWLPWFARHGLRRIVRLRRTNVLPIVWVVALVIACTAPAFWAMGQKPPKRAEGNILFVFVLGWFLLVLPCLHARLRNWTRRVGAHELGRAGRGLFAFGLLVFGNVPNALWDIASGEALRYRMQQGERTAAVRAAIASGSADIVTTMIAARPKTIWIDDLASNPADWRNDWYAKFLGVRTVKALPPQ